MSDTQILCADEDCENVINDDEASYTIIFGERAGEPLCESCADDDLADHVSSVVRYFEGRTEIVRYGDYLADIFEGTYFIDRPDCEADLPDWFRDHFGSRRYVRTDGWRGYYQNGGGNGMLKVGDGWVTGMPDESVRHKLPGVELSQYLKFNPGPDFPVYWAFDPTSNVFSTASDLYIPVDKAEEWESWLLTHLGFSAETLRRSFE